MRAIILSHHYLDPGRRGKLRALAGQGCALVAAVPGGGAVEDAGVRLAPIPAAGPPDRPTELAWGRRALRRLFTDFHPDVIQIEEEPHTKAAARAASEAARLRIPVVQFSWEAQDPASGFLERRRVAACLRVARGAIGGNAVAARRLEGLLPGKPVAVVPQFGVAPPPPMSRNPKEELAIGLVGRLTPERGVDMLLRACAEVIGAWSLTIAGTGPEQESLEDLAQRLGLASRIRWLGGVQRAEVLALWPSLDCLVVPTQPAGLAEERWSTVLIDAMAAGVVPIVVAGGALESVVGSAGCVVGDHDSLVVALQTLRAYPGERLRLGRAARERVLESFVDAAVAEQTLALWRRVVSAGGKS